MQLPNIIIFGLEGRKLLAHIPEDPDKIIEELLKFGGGRDREEVISATLKLDLDDRGELALAIFAAEDEEMQNASVVPDKSTGFALKSLLAKAFVAGVRFGRSKPNVQVELVEESI